MPLYIAITPQVAEALSRHLGFDSYTHADSPLSENRISFTGIVFFKIITVGRVLPLVFAIDFNSNSGSGQEYF